MVWSTFDFSDGTEAVTGLNAGGETHERIYDVACSDGRAIRNRRCEREVGSTVDVADASLLWLLNFL